MSRASNKFKMPTLVPVRKQGQKNKGERIKMESILYVRTDLKITKPKEIFHYKHCFTNSPLGVEK